MNAALTQVSVLSRAANELSRDEDGLRGRFNHLVSFSVRDAHLRRTKPGMPGGSQSYVDGLPDHQSRMGAFNIHALFFELILWFNLILISRAQD